MHILLWKMFQSIIPSDSNFAGPAFLLVIDPSCNLMMLGPLTVDMISRSR